MDRWRLVILVTALLTAAGDAEARKVSFGIKAGTSICSITETPSAWNPEKSFKAGVAAGAFMIYEWENGFGVQPELLYLQKGVSTSLYEGFVNVDMNLNLDYIEIPLLAKYTFQLRGKFKPNVYAGPAFAYSLSSELETQAGIFAAGVDFSSMTHVTDFGVIVGGGFGIETAKGIITFDARYERDFTNVILTGDFTINGSTQTIEGDDFKNHGMAFMIGYIF